MRAMVDHPAAEAGTSPVAVRRLSPVLLGAAGLFSPLLRETRYQFDHPSGVDSTAYETAFAVRATPLEEQLAATVEPGVVLTDMTAGWTDAPEAMAGLESIAALGRIGEPEDVADVVGFLAGPQGRWVTGQTIGVSGGTYLGPLTGG
jgi:hypothetical protein